MMLYHGTLQRHLPSIQSEGILPRIGDFTRRSYGENAEGLVAAVFLADQQGLERVVHAMVAAIMNEVDDEDYQQYDIGPHYHMNDAIFAKYGALLLVEPCPAFRRFGQETGEPVQAEEGDWYSLEPVVATRSIVGEELLEFLADQGLLPSQINGFVDPEVTPVMKGKSVI